MDATMIGPYRLERLLGFGGMGEVHLAYDTRRDRMVALKLLSEALSRDTEYQERFRRESHVAARLRDPHVVPIHDFGEVDGHLFLDMRLVEGRNIRQILEADGPLPPTRAVHLVGQVAEALEAAHADGLVHRDVKPSNVLVTATDFVYVVDFGIARSIGSARSSLTLTGVTVGTLDYMAPERFSGQAVDGRTDVYSLACLLHECLTGVPPFAGDDLPALMYAHLFADPPRASEQIAGLPAGLDAVIATGCAKQIEDRYPGPLAMVQAARAVLAGGTAPPVTGRTPAPTGPAATPTAASSAGSSAGSAATSTPSPTAGSTPGSGAAPPAPLTVVPGAGPDVAAPTVAAAGPTRVSGPSAPGRPGTGSRAATGEPPTVAVPATVAVPPPGGPVGPPPGRPNGPRPAPAPEPPPRRRRAALLVAAAGLAVVAVAAAVLVVPLVGTPDAATPIGPSGTPVPPPVSEVAASVAVPLVSGTIEVGPTPGYMHLSPNGRFGYIAHRDAGYVTVLDTTINQVTATIPVPAGPPQFVAFSPDGSRAYLSIYNTERTVNLIGVLDTATNTLLSTVPVGRRPFASATTADGSRLYVPSHDDGRLDVIDTASGEIVNRIPVAPNPHWVAFSPDGSRLYTANHESGVVTEIDPATDEVLGTVDVGVSPHSTTVSPDGGRVAVVNYDSDELSLIDTATRTVAATVPVGESPQDVAYSADGRFLYTANVDSDDLSVVDAATGTVTATIPTGDGPTSVAVRPDGRQAYVTLLNEGVVLVIDTAATG